MIKIQCPSPEQEEKAVTDRSMNSKSKETVAKIKKAN